MEITSGGSYTIEESNSTITIATTEAVTLTGNADTQLEEVVITTTADNANLTIDNLNITNTYTTIITVGEGSENNLNFTGTNTLTVSNMNEATNRSGACVNVGGGLTVNGTGTLNCNSFSGACIGVDGNQNLSDSNITIESGTYVLNVAQGACAIGGAGSGNNAIGDILITGTADITAKVPHGYAGAVGASYRGSCGNITINGDAKIDAEVGQATAAIGAGAFTTVGDITINGNAEVNARNTSKSDAPAGIGSGIGAKCMQIGNIVIGGNAKVTASSNRGLAIDNHEWYRESSKITDPESENDHALENTDATITIGENATFTGTSGDNSTDVVINGTTLYAATINYNATDGLTYSGGEKTDSAIDEIFLNITEGGSYTIAEGSVGIVSIKTADAVTITGGDYTLENVRILVESETTDLTIEDLTIYNPENSVIRLGSGAGNKLTIAGTNDFSNDVADPAIIHVGGGVEIDGDGSIKIVSTHGSPIGTDRSEDLETSNITISGGTFDLLNKSGGACIGGCGNTSKIGDITITGTANIKASAPLGYAAAIGGGYQGVVGDITINGDATVDASCGQVGAAIGGGPFGTVGDVTIGGRASVVANGADASHPEAAIGSNFRDQVRTLGNISVTDDATLIAFSAAGLAVNNLLAQSIRSDNSIHFSGDTSTENKSLVILNNGADEDVVTIGADSYNPLQGHMTVSSAYQGGKMVFYDGNLAMTGNWISLEAGGWSYSSVVQSDLLRNFRNDKAAQFTLSGGNLKDDDGDGIPDNISIGSILYIQQSGVHTNINHLSGNVVYNGDALGIEGDEDYNIEAIAPIDLSETFGNTYITDPNVTAMRGISNNATISPRGTAGTETAADWISIDSTDSKVTFLDGSYCVYTENKFSSRNYTKLSISNNNEGVVVSTSNDLIQTIGNLADGYAITIESGINVGEKINFETSGNGVIVVKTTANSGKYSLDADSDEWQYQNYTINGGGNFAVVFGDNGSVVGMEDFDGTLETDDTTLSKGEWVTLDGGGFEYTGAATNNPSKSASFTVSGDSITSTDNLTVTNNVYFAALGGNRMAVAGLSGNASVDGVELGISGDSYYSAHFSEIQDGASNIALMNVSDGSTVGNNYSIGVEDTTAQIQFNDGEHVVFTNTYFPTQDFTTITAENGGNGFTLNIVDDKFETISGLSSGYELNITAGGNIGDSLAIQTDGKTGTITVGEETFTVNGDTEFGLQFNEDSVELVDYEGWTTISSGVYNYVSDSLDFTVEGSDINWDIARIGKKVVPLGDDAYQIALASIGGNVKVNGVDMGIYNDDQYTIHVYVYPDTAAPADIATNISEGASVNASYDTLIIDDNAKVHISDGQRVVVMGMHFVNKDFTSIDVENGGNGFYLQSLNDKFTTFSGLSSDFNISIEPGGNIGDEVTFETDGKSGTIIVGDRTLKVDGDAEFAIKLDDDGNLKGLKNFDGSSVLITNDGDSSTIEGSDGDDLLAAGNAVNVTMTGGAGNDTFKGGASLESALITDYTEDEDVIYHGKAFSALSINGSIVDNDYIFETNGRTITVKDAADKIIKVVDVNGDERLFGKYLTLDDNAPATVTAQDGVATIDASARTTDIEIIGNDGDNVIIGGGTNATMTGGEGNDTFKGSANLTNGIITDYTEDEDVIYNAQPFADLSINGSIVGNDYVVSLNGKTTTIKDGADKVIKVVDVNGDERLFGKYLTLDDNDPATVTAQDGVATIDASARTTDIVVIGNSGDNTILSSSGNCTLYGGEGADTFVKGSRSGNQTKILVVADFDEDADEVYHGRAFSDFSLLDVAEADGDDYAFNAGGATIKYIDGANKKLKFVDVNGDVAYFGNYLTIIDVDSDTITASEKVKVLDASARTEDIQLIGNAIDNTIYGGGTNATLEGGDGDDLLISSTATNVTMTGGAGNDTFRGGASLKSAFITDYNEDEDIIYHAQTFEAFPIEGSTDGNDYVLNVNGRTITVKDGASKVIKVVDSNGDAQLFATTKGKLASITNGYVENYDYGEEITDSAEVATLLESIEAGKLDGDMALLLEDESADFRKSDGAKSVTLAGGRNQNVIFNKAGDNTAVIDSEALGKKNISLGGGGDVVFVEETGAKVNVTAGKGNDIIVSEGENVSVKLNGGKTDIFAAGGKMTLDGYDASTGTGFGTDYADVLEAFQNGDFDFEKGKLTIGAAVVDFGKDSELINIFDASDDLQKVGFVSDDDSLNTANEKADLILVGEKGSTLTGGKGEDSIFADDGSIVDGGAGQNYIFLNDVDTEGTTIALSGGRNTIENFNATFDDGDKVSVDATTADLKFDGATLTVKNNGARALIENITAEDGTARILTVADGKEFKTAIAQKNSIIAVGDDDAAADIYIGKKSGVDFTSFEESLVVDLTDGKSYRGINQITIGGGLNTLIGSSANETLTGNANGVTEFVFNAGSGRDVIRNFNFEEDRINVGSNVITNVVLNKSGGVRLEMGEDRLTIEDAQGKNFRINEFTAKVDTNLEYDDEANYYVASSRNATLTVADEAEIWLDGSHGKYFVGDIKTLDATNSDGRNILAGNDLNNTILAGGGNASLWGGNGGDDLLVGGEGQNMFFYTNGNGNDTINGIKDGDVVYLSAVTLENLASTEFNSGAVTINFKDGGKLTINDGGADVGIVLGDQTYYVDSERKDFVTEK